MFFLPGGKGQRSVGAHFPQMCLCNKDIKDDSRPLGVGCLVPLIGVLGLLEARLLPPNSISPHKRNLREMSFHLHKSDKNLKSCSQVLARSETTEGKTVATIKNFATDINKA